MNCGKDEKTVKLSVGFSLAPDLLLALIFSRDCSHEMLKRKLNMEVEGRYILAELEILS